MRCRSKQVARLHRIPVVRFVLVSTLHKLPHYHQTVLSALLGPSGPGHSSLMACYSHLGHFAQVRTSFPRRYAWQHKIHTCIPFRHLRLASGEGISRQASRRSRRQARLFAPWTSQQPSRGSFQPRSLGSECKLDSTGLGVSLALSSSACKTH